MSILGSMSPELGLSSAAYIQRAFLPMFIGNILEKSGERNVGVLIGALTQAIITAAFGRLGLATSLQNILNGVIVLCFFAYSFNNYKLVEYKIFKEKRLKANQERVEGMS